jgi:AcrR family transcriptional regulator
MTRTRAGSKSASRERIVAAGARAIRRSGYGGVSIVDIMKEANLTHGGFYAHFPSREAMLVELSDRAGADAIASFTRAAEEAPPAQSLRALLSAYLCEAHVRQPEIGCPIAALGTEMPRQAAPIRRAVTRRIKEIIDLVSRESPDFGFPGAHHRALVITATIVGTLVLARAVDDAALSESVLGAVRDHLIPSPK